MGIASRVDGEPLFVATFVQQIAIARGNATLETVHHPRSNERQQRNDQVHDQIGHIQARVAEQEGGSVSSTDHTERPSENACDRQDFQGDRANAKCNEYQSQKIKDKNKE